MTATLFGRDAVRGRKADVWAYVSATRLNSWLRCPLAFKLQYIDGLRAPSSPSLFVGKVVHASLECFYRHRQLGIALDTAELARRLIEGWASAIEDDEMDFSNAAEELECQKQAIGLVAAYVRQLPQDEQRPLAVEVSCEAPLVDPITGENLGIPLVGVMDLVLPEETGPIITDFKTASKSSGPLEITHEVQLSCYSYLFRSASPEPEAGLEIRNLVKTKTPQIQFHRYPARGEQHYRRLFAIIREFWTACTPAVSRFDQAGAVPRASFVWEHAGHGLVDARFIGPPLARIAGVVPACERAASPVARTVLLFLLAIVNSQKPHDPRTRCTPRMSFEQ